MSSGRMEQGYRLPSVQVPASARVEWYALVSSIRRLWLDSGNRNYYLQLVGFQRMEDTEVLAENSLPV